MCNDNTNSLWYARMKLLKNMPRCVVSILRTYLSKVEIIKKLTVYEFKTDPFFRFDFSRCVSVLAKRKLTSHNMAVKRKHTLVIYGKVHTISK